MLKRSSIAIIIFLLATLATGCGSAKNTQGSSTQTASSQLSSDSTNKNDIISDDKVIKDLEGKEIYVKGDSIVGGYTYKFNSTEYKLSIKGTSNNKEQLTKEIIAHIDVKHTGKENNDIMPILTTFNTDIKLYYKYYDGTGWKLENVEKSDKEDVKLDRKKIYPEFKMDNDQLKKLILGKEFTMGDGNIGGNDTRDDFKLDEKSLKSLEIIDIKETGDGTKAIIAKVKFEGQDPWNTTSKKIWKGEGNLIINFRFLGGTDNGKWEEGFPFMYPDKNNFKYSVEK